MRAALHVGDKFRYRVEASIEATVTTSGGLRRSRGILEIYDDVEVWAPSEIRERLSNARADGAGELVDTMKRVVAILPSATVTTHFDPNWQVASSSIDGTDDDEARTMIMNLTPVVSFRLMPKEPVAVGDTWQNQWGEALRSEQGSAAGNVSTSVRYTLRGVAPCGARTCATIVGEGEDAIPAQEGTTGGTSSFHGEQQVEITNLVPVAKRIESRTMIRGEKLRQPLEYTNTATVWIEQVDR